MTVADVLNAAADNLRNREEFRVKRDLRGGAGPAMFEVLYETAKQMYGWTAVQHLERHLGAALSGGQLQNWRESDFAVVIKVLREAAGKPVDEDLEVHTLRTKLAEFHGTLAEALGWLVAEPAVLVRETVAEMARLRAENDRLTREVAKRRPPPLLPEETPMPNTRPTR